MKKNLLAAIMLVTASSLMAQEPIVWKEVIVNPLTIDSIKNVEQLSNEDYLTALENVNNTVKDNLQNIKAGLDEAKERKKSVEAEDKLIDQEIKAVEQDNKLINSGIKTRQSQAKNFDKQIKALKKNKEMSDAVRQSQLSSIDNQKADLERQNLQAGKKLDENKLKLQEIDKRNVTNADKRAVVDNRITELTSALDHQKNEETRVKNEIKVVKARIKADKKLQEADK
jgi:chromosome segregation ATPase